MSLSPGSILQKLDELKKWQSKQQERLLGQHHKQLTENSNPRPEPTQTDPVSKSKPKENESIIINAKPKQPYLRRGAGLTRFHMSPGEQFKPFANKSTKPVDTCPKKTNKNEESYLPLRKPDTCLPKAVWENAGHNETDRELAIFETLERRASNNSFCSTNSSIVRLLSSSTPSKAKNQIENNPNDYENKIRHDYLNLINKAAEFKNYMETNLTPASSLTSVNTLQVDSYNDKNNWNDSVVVTSGSSASSSLSEQDAIDDNTDLDVVEDNTKLDAETMTDLVEPDDNMQEKLSELESKLQEMRSENAKGKKLAERLEQKSKEFEKYKKETTKLLEEEKSRVNSMLEEEKKKLAKEKMVFERYAKDLRDKPSRKEREEIAALKMEVATLKETLKIKETRNGTAQARLRNQVKALEKENANLKTEIDNLNKQHAKLVVFQKLNTKPSNTKMLHEINKNLSKLTLKQARKNVTAIESSEDEESSASSKVEDEREVVNENNRNSLENTFPNESRNDKDRVEQIFSDGTKQIRYSNGNIKNISSDGNIIIFRYFNGDVKETNLLEGSIRYHYFETKVNHTTNADGSELIQFPDGQTEKRFKDGSCEIGYPNGINRKINVHGEEDIFYPDGTVVNIQNDVRVITLPNGQKEIHTDDHKRREYPDGTVKILYPDGTQETRYTSGRIRLKDKYGKLIADSQH